MTRVHRLIAWLERAVSLPDRQCEAILVEAMRRAGWKKATRLRVRRTR